jgi:hypothetical protein
MAKGALFFVISGCYALRAALQAEENEELLQRLFAQASAQQTSMSL